MSKDKMFGNSTFVFVGELAHGKEPLVTNQMGTGEWYKTRLNVSVRNGANSPFLTMEDIHKDLVAKEVSLYTKEGTQITVPANKTESEEVMKQVPDFMKVVIDLETDWEKKKEYTSLIFKRRNHEMKKEEDKTEDDIAKIEEYTKQINELATNRKEFIMKDAMLFLNTALLILKGKKVKVTGNVKSNYYNGRNNLQYIPSLIELVPEETPTVSKAYMDVFYEKDGIEEDKKERKIFVNGYIGEKVKKVDKLYPVSLVVDYSKIHEDNEFEMKMLEFLRDSIKITNKKMVHKNRLEINVINGAEEKEFTYDCLTPAQKMKVDLKMATVESFKPKNGVFGNRIQELKIISPTLKGEFENGTIEVFETDELLDYIVQDDSDVKAEDVKKDEPKEEKKEEDTSDLMSKLFG